MLWWLAVLPLLTNAFHVMHVSECGMLRGCWRVPKGCQQDCDLTVTWKHQGRAVMFEIEANLTLAANGGWVGFAISKDDRMGNDTVIECVFPSTGAGAVHLSHNTQKENLRLSEASQLTLKDSWTEVIDGRVQCGTEWRLDTTVLSKDEKKMIHALNSGEYHLLFARGPLETDGEKAVHAFGDDGPVVSVESVRFCKECASRGHQVENWVRH